MRKLLPHTLALGLLLGLPMLSHADLIFTLEQPVQSVSPGQTLTYTGTLTNLNGPTVFLNGDTFTLDGPGLLLDNSTFLLNAPLSLDSGDAYTGTFFTVTADPMAPPQTTVGEFNIVGGLTDADQSLLATKEFEVNVVPEPGSAALLVGLMGMGGLCCRRRLRRKQGNRQKLAGASHPSSLSNSPLAIQAALYLGKSPSRCNG